jgi:hypothetical protein
MRKGRKGRVSLNFALQVVTACIQEEDIQMGRNHRAQWKYYPEKTKPNNFANISICGARIYMFSGPHILPTLKHVKSSQTKHLPETSLLRIRTMLNCESLHTKLKI